MIMKRLMMMAIAVAMVCSCSKEELKVETGEESMLYVSLQPEDGTKAGGASHGVQADDNHIKTLEIFVFRINEGKADDGMLDGYRKFTAEELGTLTNLEIQTTTGKKMIYAVANSHMASWKGINTRKLFEEQTAQLVQDDVRDFIMVGGTQAQLQLASTVSFSIRRMVARVKLNSVKTAFAGGPYEGMSLADVKAYLINVQGSKLMYNGSGNNYAILNNGGYVEDDVNSCAMQGMLYDALASAVTDAGYSTPHYFYCYENAIESEESGSKFTRLVVEGKLDGTTYYYPVILKGVARNSCYSVDITIRRPGSTDPGKDVEKGSLMASIAVEDWKVEDGNEVEF
jgi:hypothetical protein